MENSPSSWALWASVSLIPHLCTASQKSIVVDGADKGTSGLKNPGKDVGVGQLQSS